MKSFASHSQNEGCLGEDGPPKRIKVLDSVVPEGLSGFKDYGRTLYT
jgi:hypothetical protein